MIIELWINEYFYINYNVFYMDRRCFALFFLIIVLSLPAFSSSLGPAGWLYRRPVDMSSSASLSNYQVKVVLDTASLIGSGKMRQDCGDVRFTDLDDSTLLPYWMEGGCGSPDTVFWIKVPVVSISKEIYLYYGNPDAVYLGSGDRTFEFFDDFEGDVLDNYKWDENPTVQVSSGYVHLSRPVAGGTSIRMKGRLASTGVVEIKVRRGGAEAGSGPGVFLGYAENAMVGGVFQGADAKSGKWGLNVIPKTEWSYDGNLDSLDHIYSMAYTTGRLYYSYVDSAPIAKDLPLTNSPFTSLQLGAGDAQKQSDSYFDWIYIRKYSDPEPVVSIGSEEDSKGASTTTKATVSTTTLSASVGSLKTTATMAKDAETTITSTVPGTSLSGGSESKDAEGGSFGLLILLLLILLLFYLIAGYYKKKQSLASLINQCIESQQRIESLKTVKATMLNEYHSRKVTEEDARKMVLDCEKDLIMERSKLRNLAIKLGINSDGLSGREEAIGWIMEKLSAGEKVQVIKKELAAQDIDIKIVDEVKKAIRV